MHKHNVFSVVFVIVVIVFFFFNSFVVRGGNGVLSIDGGGYFDNDYLYSLSPTEDSLVLDSLSNEEATAFSDANTQIFLGVVRPNLRYPQEAQEYGIQGMSVIEIIVEKDGSISDMEIIKSSHKLLDDEAIRALKIVPVWVPAQHNNQNVRAKMQLPFKFTL